ncbi:putative amino-acid permease meu22 [Cytospora mali]|uniref:Amino-acid permease meu22 n=1 Tax=Cytospora mali TaxID=578113 RepID=A0A194WB85_CYTMA|nr:putative amino-acid permease meu22 [Valsa mali]
MQTMGDTQLRQELRSYQILFIVLSALIGTGVFVTNTEPLELSGPDGLLFALVVLGIITVSVGDTVGHLVQFFPAPNAIFEYTYNFVDHELAWVVGFAYWYAWVAVFATEFLQAASIAAYWNPSDNLISILFYIITPLIFVVLNCFNVKYFGWVETVGGILKVILMIGVSIALYTVAAEDGEGGQSGPINAKFQTNENYTNNFGTAFCMGLPLVAWSFGGIESTTVAAFEARSVKDIARASSSVHWITFSLYLLFTISIMLTVPWNDPSLPAIYSQATSNTARHGDHCGSSQIAVVVALCNERSGHQSRPGLAGFVNGCLLYSVLSAGNTALYVASRTLYGLASSPRLRERGYLGRFMRSLGTTHPRTGVPVYAVVFSWLIFCWVPLLAFHSEPWEVLDGIKQFLFVTSSMAYVVVWTVLCFAFIRFRRWYVFAGGTLPINPSRYIQLRDANFSRANKCRKGLERLDRENRPNTPSSALASEMGENDDHYHKFVSNDSITTYRKHVNYFLPQPLAAWTGLTGCFLLFIVSSSVWWDNNSMVSRAWSVSVFFLEGIIIFFWLVLKVWNMTWDMSWKTGWISTNDNPDYPSELKETLDNLVRASEKGERRSEAQRLANGATSRPPISSAGV